MDIIEAMITTTASVVVAPTVAQLQIGHTTIHVVTAQPPTVVTTVGVIHFGGATPIPHPPPAAILGVGVLPDIPPLPAPFPIYAVPDDETTTGTTVAEMDFPAHTATHRIEQAAFVRNIAN